MGNRKQRPRTSQKKKRESYRCPLCGTVYVSRDMADFCQKTEACRRHNAPDAERRTIYTLHASLICCVLCAARRLAEQDADQKPLARDMEIRAGGLFEMLSACECGQWLFETTRKTVDGLLESLWKDLTGLTDTTVQKAPEEQKDHVHATAAFLVAVRSLTERLIRTVGESPTAFTDRTLSEWQMIRARLTMALERFPGTAVPEEALRSLLQYLWPVEQKKPLQLYLLGDRFWVAARTRQEARDIVRKELGLTRLPVRGIPLSEVMEDGRLGRDLLALAEDTPMLLGRTS